MDLLIIVGFLTVGIDSDAASDLFAVLVKHSRTINLGSVDMCKLRDDQAPADKNHWE
ncbi:hypothetical protein [Cryobacterium psychrophilum]|uniref:hypothetical protein n=1 Tax=Cryobacterium psychrophilum TaxID=41988 RepID=UPI0014170EEF|nr:hypothetical protein [Cryobacterium psychrophilum]